MWFLLLFLLFAVGMSVNIMRKARRWIQLSIRICDTYTHLNLFQNRFEATKQNDLDLHFFPEKTDSKGKKE